MRRAHGVLPSAAVVLSTIAVVMVCCVGAWTQGFPTDWSNRHVVFNHNKPMTAQQQWNSSRDVRRVVDWMKRTNAALAASADRSGVAPRTLPLRPAARRMPVIGTRPAKALPVPPVGTVDWSASLDGGTLADGVFPAKWRIRVDTTDPNDWVVYGTTAGKLIALTNLYSTAPTRKFTYPATGTYSPITTSPVISALGDKIAFIESGATSARLHVVKSDGTGEVTSIDLLAADKNSSPFVDYSNDVLYVGTDDGKLHKITGIFEGTPTEQITGGWPVQVASAAVGGTTYLTSPALYNNYATPTPGPGIILIGGSFDDRGNTAATLWLVDLRTMTKANAQIAYASASIFDGPLVDIDNRVVYVFTNNNGKQNARAELAQVVLNVADNMSASFGAITVAQLATGKLKTTQPIRVGAFDNAWYTTGTGYLVACGIDDNKNSYPSLFSFRVAGATLTPTPVGSAALSADRNDSCSPITEAVSGTTDHFFVGTKLNGISSNCSASGCIQQITLSGGIPSVTAGQREASGTSGIVIDTTNIYNATPGPVANIYFTTLAPGGNSGGNGPAIQLKQSDLQ
ncbi:MAG TPA: hypothetical protein VD837_03690 [Terriglobales bacterium]|nr:hypothetical protein [Terriglobales bacterium]